MALFDDETLTSPEEYYEQIKDRLVRDGMLHVIMLNVKTTSDDSMPVCEWGYTSKVDTTLTAMQREGFAILGVTFGSTREGLADTLTLYHVQVTYRWQGAPTGATKTA